MGVVTGTAGVGRPPAVVDGVALVGGAVGVAVVVDSALAPPKKFRMPLKNPFFVVLSGASVVVVEVDVVGGGR